MRFLALSNSSLSWFRRPARPRRHQGAWTLSGTLWQSVSRDVEALTNASCSFTGVWEAFFLYALGDSHFVDDPCSMFHMEPGFPLSISSVVCPYSTKNLRSSCSVRIQMGHVQNGTWHIFMPHGKLVVNIPCGDWTVHTHMGYGITMSSMEPGCSVFLVDYVLSLYYVDHALSTFHMQHG